MDAVLSVFERGVEVSGTFRRTVSVGFVADAFVTVLLPSDDRVDAFKVTVFSSAKVSVKEGVVPNIGVVVECKVVRFSGVSSVSAEGIPEEGSSVTASEALSDIEVLAALEVPEARVSVDAVGVCSSRRSVAGLLSFGDGCGRSEWDCETPAERLALFSPAVFRNGVSVGSVSAPVKVLRSSFGLFTGSRETSGASKNDDCNAICSSRVTLLATAPPAVLSAELWEFISNFTGFS